MSDDIFGKFFETEIQFWWSESFWEYKSCPDCEKIFSVEEVCWWVEEFKKWNKWENHCCPDCGITTDYIYYTESYRDLLRWYTEQQVSIVLLMSEEDAINWLAVLRKAKLRELIDLEFSTRKESYKKDDVEREVGKILAKKDTWDDDLVCLQHFYLDRSVRNWAKSYELLRKLFSLNPEYANLPLIQETMYRSRFYQKAISLWFRDALNDETHWYVIQVVRRYSEVLKVLEKHNSFIEIE